MPLPRSIRARRRQVWEYPDQGWGASSAEEWKTYVAIAAKITGNPNLPQQIGDLSNVYTNELVDEFNNFDRAAVVTQAKDFKL